MQRDILIQFGKKLRELRKRNNLTQVELSERAGFDRNYIGINEIIISDIFSFFFLILHKILLII